MTKEERATLTAVCNRLINQELELEKEIAPLQKTAGLVRRERAALQNTLAQEKQKGVE